MDKKSWIFGSVLVLAMVGVAVGLNFWHSQNGSENGAVSEVIDIDNGDLKINWEKYAPVNVDLSGTYTIAAAGVYHFTGSLEDGGIVIKANVETAAVKIILDNVSIKNSSGPAIACYNADDLVIELVGENHLEDGISYSGYDEDVKGVIYSKSDLTFTGDGELVLKGNYADGIVGKDDLTFRNGTYNITAADDAIRGKDSVHIANGDFVITTKGDGIKSTNDTKTDKGFVLVENGNIEITSGDDGVHAEKSLIIDGGELEIKNSYEGLEAQKIIINNGETTIFSNDDGINASSGSSTTTNTNVRGTTPGAMGDVDENSVITVNGGKLYVNAAGDGIDSNGWIYFNGGSVVVDGPTNNGNGALDAGAGIVMNGGTVIAVGASGMAESLGSSSTVYNASIFFDSTLPKGTSIAIKDSNNETVLSHTSAKTFSHMAIGTKGFENGQTYTIYIDGEKYSSFTIADIVTMVGNGGYMNAMPGGNTPGGNAGNAPAGNAGNAPSDRPHR